MHHMREASNKNLTPNQWNSATIQQLSTQQSVWPTNQDKIRSESRFMNYSSSKRPCKPRVFNIQLIFWIYFQENISAIENSGTWVLCRICPFWLLRGSFTKFIAIWEKIMVISNQRFQKLWLAVFWIHG